MSLRFSTLAARFRARRGFALLMTVTLLAFIVVLLLGLAVYTRVETAVAGNTQRQAQARENALLALNIALGQLQQHAGPDTRVTATGQNFGAVDGTRHYTGVWSSDPLATATPATPLTWLISGNEIPQAPLPPPEDGGSPSTVPLPPVVTPADPGTLTVDLVGHNSTVGTSATPTRNADYVIAPLQEIKSMGVPGVSPTAALPTIGRYAWWVGDQGVKAPVALPDTTDAINFAPYGSGTAQGDLGRRIQQQLSLGAGAANGTDGEPAFEPRDSNNAALVADGKIAAPSQLAFLRTPTNTQVGLAGLRPNIHAWSPNNFAVLANTKSGGLREDLSLQPGLLGEAFTAWANYPAYMEKFVPDVPVEDGEGSTPPPATTAPPILPAYSADPIRRRYVMTPHLRDENGGGSHQVGPVLTYFLLSFNVRALPTGGDNPATTSQPLEVRARWMISLWNPYTTSLVPEKLRIEISGLPRSVRVINESAERTGTVGSFSLSDESSPFGSPLKIALPWDAENAPSGAPLEDRQSWLPGRVYTWRSIENRNKNQPPPEQGFDSQFYSRTLSESGAGVIRQLSLPEVDGDDPCVLQVDGDASLLVTLYAVRPDGDVRLGAFISAPFLESFSTTAQSIGKFGYQFSYVFRLGESIDTPTNPGTWLSTTERDLRRGTLPSEAFVVEADGNNPAAYPDYQKISTPDRLLDRAGSAYSYNEDVPVFELPRAPLLSLGALQHFRLTGQRPFMIGNPWGATFELNQIPTAALFDRFFFSGLASETTPGTTQTGDLVLPNPLMKPLRKSDHTKVTIDDIRNLIAPPVVTDPEGNVIPGPAPSSASSKYFLQGGAFNLNSINAAAWAAVLRGVRFPTDERAFTYLNSSTETGTAEDAAFASVPASGEAQFFRFSQSAQETFKAEPGMADSTGDPATPSPANTHLFRRGMRTLTAAQVAAFAAKIVELVAIKHAAADSAGGPFRSLEEFLSPSPLFAGVDADGNPLAPRSLLEAAIADAGLNTSIAEFSSQWLTQADVMTALAPILFPRSDTFVIRTYGEAVNPAKLNANGTVPADAIEGRAWAEAIVQRVPEYFDPSMAPESPTSAFDPVPDPNDPEAPPVSTEAQELNKKFGRRFKVISFRWLTRSDI